jgi:hypothetical protein
VKVKRSGPKMMTWLHEIAEKYVSEVILFRYSRLCSWYTISNDAKLLFCKVLVINMTMYDCIVVHSIMLIRATYALKLLDSTN